VIRSQVYISHREYIPETPAEFSEVSLKMVRGMLEEAVQPFGLGAKVRGKVVWLKPNFVRPDYRYNPAVCSDARAVLGLGRILREAGAKEVWVGDNPGVGLSFKGTLSEIPGAERWESMGLKPFFYEDYEQVEINLPGAKLFRRMIVPRKMLEFEALVNLAKIKTHMHVVASLGIKNLYGLLSDEQRMTFHRQDVNIKLVEIMQRFRPEVTVLEGIWGLEGQAPICGEAVKDFNTIIGGANTLAVDVVGAEAMGISPWELTTNRIAHRRGLGPIDLSEIEVLGTPLAQVRRYFKRAVVSSMGAYENCEVYELGADIGTMSSLRHALDRLHYGGELSKLPRNTFILGIPGEFYQPLAEWEGDLWLIGDAVSEAYGEGANIVRVGGSPPHFGEILRELKRRYL